jgi:uncharacterized protein
MGRFVFLALVALAIYLLWRWVSARDRAGGPETPPSSERAKQAMVSCAACGLHLPRPDALALGEYYFCCEEHRARGPSAKR